MYIYIFVTLRYNTLVERSSWGIHSTVYTVTKVITERLSAELLTVQCSQFAFVFMYVYTYTLIAWARFLWSRPQEAIKRSCVVSQARLSSGESGLRD